MQAIVFGFFERLQCRMSRITASRVPRTPRAIFVTCEARVVLCLQDVIGDDDDPLARPIGQLDERRLMRRVSHPVNSPMVIPGVDGSYRVAAVWRHDHGRAPSKGAPRRFQPIAGSGWTAVC